MANLVVALIALGSFLGVVAALIQGSLAPQMHISNSWKEMRAMTQQSARTELEEVDLQVQSSGAEIRLTAANTGAASVRDFGNWDVIVSYQESSTSTDFLVRRLSYTTGGTPGDNEWAVNGLYLDANLGIDEVFDPGILDPGEQVVLQLRLAPPSATSTPGQIVLATENGVTLSAQFTH